MSYVIEDNVPIPKRKNGASGGAPRCPLTDWTKKLDLLRPGQSILTDRFSDVKAADQFKLRRPGRVFTSRKIPGEGWRVWRVE